MKETQHDDEETFGYGIFKSCLVCCHEANLDPLIYLVYIIDVEYTAQVEVYCKILMSARAKIQYTKLLHPILLQLNKG